MSSFTILSRSLSVCGDRRRWRSKKSPRTSLQKGQIRTGASVRARGRGVSVVAAAVSPGRALVKPGQGVKRVNMVYKFGGSSLADAKRMEEVADIVCSFPQFYPCIVLSAMGKTTNLLIEAGQKALETASDEIASIAAFAEISDHHLETAEALRVGDDVQRQIEALLNELKQLLTGISMMQELTPRAKDAVVSFGERMSTRLFAGFLQSCDVPAAQFDAWKLGFLSTDDFSSADVMLDVTLPAIQKSLWSLKDEIPVVTGFLAKGQKTGAITTLGRGGSDLTATVIGLALGLPEVQVWKDVDGVLTSDPRIVPTAHSLPVLTYDEASELAYFGAQVLHPRAMMPATLSKEGMKVRVKNSYNRMAPGTVIQSDRDLTETLLTSMVIKRGISVVDIVSTRMMGQFGFLARVFQVFKENGISVDVVATSEISVSISLDVDRYVGEEGDDDPEALLKQFEGWADVSLRRGLSILSLICNIGRSSEILEVVFRCLRDEGVNVQMISQGASKTNISLIVHDDEVDRAVTVIHDQFFNNT